MASTVETKKWTKRGAREGALSVLAGLLLAFAFGLAACDAIAPTVPHGTASTAAEAVEPMEPSPVEWGGSGFDYSAVPPYSGSPAVTLGEGVPFFESADFERGQFEEYGELDGLGRCGVAFALVGAETIPAEGTNREGNGSVKPSGFQYDRYSWIPGKYLYNRCHLIAWSLAANPDEKADLARDLITGTYQMNHAMTDYERAVAAYVKDTGNHVLYRVTPVFEGDDLVARGVLIEAASYEDAGSSLRYCVWCYNVQEGVSIDYETGANGADGSIGEPEEAALEFAYILNTSTKAIHLPECRHVGTMKDSNKDGSNDSIDELIARGYHACSNCKP